MTFALALAAAGGLAALWILGVRSDAYHSRQGSVLLNGSRAVGLGLLALGALGLWVPRPPAPPGTAVLVEWAALSEADGRERLKAALDGAAGPDSPEGTLYLALFGDPGAEGPPPGLPHPTFPTLDEARLWAQWEARHLPGLSERLIMARGEGTGRPARAEPRPLLEVRAPAEGLAGRELPVAVSVLGRTGVLRVGVFRGGELLEVQEARPSALDRGPVALSFSVPLEVPGATQVRIEVRDEADLLVDQRVLPLRVHAPPRVAWFYPGGALPPLARLLRDEGCAVDLRPSRELAGGAAAALAGLGAGDLIVLDAVPPAHLRADAVQALGEAVALAGVGLLAIPGAVQNTAYRDTPVEALLPLRMGPPDADGPRESVAFVAVVDTSFSMYVPLGGIAKIDLARRALANIADAVRPGDRLGVLGVNESPFWVVSPAEPLEPEPAKARILRMYAGDGGIYLYSGLREAFRVLREVPSEIRHVVLLVDANDIDEFGVAGVGTVPELLQEMRAEGITLSAVAFGGPGDRHVPFLNRAVQDMGGYLYLSTNPADVPTFFLEDLEEVTRNVVVRGELEVRFDPAELPALEALPPLAGQVIGAAKPDARLLAWSDRGYPVLALRRIGRGAAAVFTGDAGGELSPALASGAQAAAFWRAVVPKLLAPQEDAPRLFLSPVPGGLEAALSLPGREGGEPPTALWRGPGESAAGAFREEAPGAFRAVLPLGPGDAGDHLVQVFLPAPRGPRWGAEGALRLAAASPSSAPEPQPGPPAAFPSWAGALASGREAGLLAFLLTLAVGLFALEEAFRMP